MSWVEGQDGAPAESRGGTEACEPGVPDAGTSVEDAPRWYVAHTRARCEKKLAEQCARWGVPVTLPRYRSVRKYRRKTVSFEKPLFPGYVFLRLPKAERSRVLQSEYVANLLEVPNQEEFQAQLDAILQALETQYEVRLCPTIATGSRVRVRSGALRGLEGYVEMRRGPVEVHLRLDFIGQAAAVRMDADLLELV